MAPETYKAALTEAKADLADCIAELGTVHVRAEELEARIFELRQTIASLAKLCGEEYVEEDALGLTDSVRLALKTAGSEMTPQTLRARLQSMGFDISKYGNLLAAIHTVLKRLVDKGQVKDVGKGSYAWIGTSPTREEQLEASRRFEEARKIHRSHGASSSIESGWISGYGEIPKKNK